jgi:hypothetical protein
VLLLIQHVAEPHTQEGAATYLFIFECLSYAAVIFVQPRRKKEATVIFIQASYF